MSKSARIRYREQRALEQGGRCFYCSLRMGEDCTLEHLKSQADGGGWEYANLRAAHGNCNVMVGCLPVPDKLRLHWIGWNEGSDAFFREIALVVEARMSRVQRKKAKRKSKNARHLETKAKFTVVRTYQPTDGEVFAKIAAHERRIHQRLGLPVPASARREAFRTPAEAQLQSQGAGGTSSAARPAGHSDEPRS